MKLHVTSPVQLLCEEILPASRLWRRLVLEDFYNFEIFHLQMWVKKSIHRGGGAPAHSEHAPITAHTQPQPLDKCDQCGYFFTRTNNLSAHMKSDNATTSSSQPNTLQLPHSPNPQSPTIAEATKPICNWKRPLCHRRMLLTQHYRCIPTKRDENSGRNINHPHPM